MTRKSPYRHKVKAHKRRYPIRRDGSRRKGMVLVSAYWRGIGVAPMKKPRKLSMKILREIHDLRPLRAKNIDEALQGELAQNPETWIERPNKYDIWGVDFFPIPTVKGDFELNAHLIKYGIEEYFNTSVKDLKIIPTTSYVEFRNLYDPHKSVEEVMKRVYAFYSPSKKAVVFSPKAVEIIKKGKIENESDFYAFHTIAHEFLHAIGSITDTHLPYGADEGATELLSTRFTLDSIQMPRKLRQRLIDQPLIAYKDRTHYISALSLLANNGDPQKALKWLIKLYTSNKREKQKMCSELSKKLMKLGITDYDEYKIHKQYNRIFEILKKRAYDKKISKIYDEEHKLIKKLGWRNMDEEGVLSPSTGLPIPELLEKYPHKKPIAEKYMRLVKMRDKLRKEREELEERRRKLSDKMADAKIFKGGNIVRFEDEYEFIKDQLRQHYPQAYKMVVNDPYWWTK